jgi:hypothetical protein
MVWALVALSVAELFVVHLLVALLWSGVAALVLSQSTIGLIVHRLDPSRFRTALGL